MQSSPIKEKPALPAGCVLFHPEVVLLSLLFLSFHLISSVKGNKSVCNIRELHASRRMLSRQHWQSAAGKNLKSLSRNLSARPALLLYKHLGES